MPKYRQDVTAERLREVLSYDPETGIFTWKIRAGGRCTIGSTAGGATYQGYIAIKVDKRLYRAHRLAWLYVHGEWPKEQIDHRDGNKGFNAIRNLREATNAENSQNRALSIANTSKHSGVNWEADCCRWRARIKIKGKSITVGMFKEIEDAIAARAKAKAEYHYFQPQERSMNSREAIAAAQPFTETTND